MSSCLKIKVWKLILKLVYRLIRLLLPLSSNVPPPKLACAISSGSNSSSSYASLPLPRWNFSASVKPLARCSKLSSENQTIKIQTTQAVYHHRRWVRICSSWRYAFVEQSTATLLFERQLNLDSAGQYVDPEPRQTLNAENYLKNLPYFAYSTNAARCQLYVYADREKFSDYQAVLHLLRFCSIREPKILLLWIGEKLKRFEYPEKRLF